jgi:hypothetical protein
MPTRSKTEHMDRILQSQGRQLWLTLVRTLSQLSSLIIHKKYGAIVPISTNFTKILWLLKITKYHTVNWNSWNARCLESKALIFHYKNLRASNYLQKPPVSRKGAAKKKKNLALQGSEWLTQPIKFSVLFLCEISTVTDSDNIRTSQNNKISNRRYVLTVNIKSWDERLIIIHISTTFNEWYSLVSSSNYIWKHSIRQSFCCTSQNYSCACCFIWLWTLEYRIKAWTETRAVSE